MNRRNNRQALLDDTFSSDEARSATLHIVRRAARRRRWTRYTRTIACCLAGVVAIAIALHQKQPVKNAVPPTMPSPISTVLTRHQPELIVETKHNVAGYVSSARVGGFAVVATTRATGGPIDDFQLLQLAPGAVLVHYRSGGALLIPPPSSEFLDAQ